MHCRKVCALEKGKGRHSKEGSLGIISSQLQFIVSEVCGVCEC